MTHSPSKIHTQMQPFVPLRVIKLGGSLLSLPDLRDRFNAWLSAQTPARNIIVAGGGKVVDAIRELDAIHHFSTEFTHWMCVDLMSTSARLSSELLVLEGPLSTDRELREFLANMSADGTIACIQPSAYYTPSIVVEKECELPESWDCTSDSIAAWLASSLAAEQLVLLKSVDVEFAGTGGLSPAEIQLLADCGAVDPIFPDACQNVRNVRIVNLRSRQ